MLCAYTVRYHDYASTPIGEVANPDSYGTIQEYVSWESASTAIVNEAAKFMNGLDYAHIDRIEIMKGRSTDIAVSTSKTAMTMMTRKITRINN